MDSAGIVAWGGFVIGLVFGGVGHLTGFCLTSGLRSFWLESDGRRLRAFALALAIAVLGSQCLDAAGVVQLGRSLYRQPTLSWPALALGGLLFGYGMMLANGCGSRALVLLGSGNLRSFVVLLCLGITAYAALTGVLAPLRLWLASVSSFPAPATPDGMLRWVVVVLLLAALVLFAFWSPAFRTAPDQALGAVAIGVLIPAGWLVTGWLGADEFDPVPLASLTFVAPIGEAIQYLMLATGLRLDFGPATVAGVLLGALAAALARGELVLRGFDSPRHMLRSMAGGALMGLGGALALGCSIGQGLTGLSTLAAGSAVAAGGILAGAYMGLRGPLRIAAPVAAARHY